MTPPKELKQLSVLRPERTLFALIWDWLVIAVAIAAGVHFSNVFVYLAAVVVIAGRMHGLGVLMHEAAHYRFFRNRKLGDAVADVFAAWPILATVEGYRRNHLAHHQHANTEQDPDWMVKLGQPQFSFPQRARVTVLHMLGYLATVSTVRDLAQILPRVSAGDTSPRSYRLTRLAFYLLVIGLSVWFGWWEELLLYWLVPYMTMFFLFLHVRSVAEHFGSMDYGRELGSTRTVEPYFWERWFFAPHNINYHLEHHLFPSVPFYNLPALHKLLMDDGAYRTSAHVTHGYSTGLVRECLA
jgi:fatty acid desaturase